MACCGDVTMTGVSLGIRTGSCGSLQNAVLQTQNSFSIRKPSRVSLSGSREKERFLPFICRHVGRKKVGMLILVVFALLVFLPGFIAVNKGSFIYHLYSISLSLHCWSFSLVCLKVEEVLNFIFHLEIVCLDHQLYNYVSEC